MTERVIWPVDWNRPLSMEEMRVIERIECAPDSGLGALGELVPEDRANLQSQSIVSCAGGRRAKGTGSGPSGAKAGAHRKANRGNAR